MDPGELAERSEDIHARAARSISGTIGTEPVESRQGHKVPLTNSAGTLFARSDQYQNRLLPTSEGGGTASRSVHIRSPPIRTRQPVILPYANSRSAAPQPFPQFTHPQQVVHQRPRQNSFPMSRGSSAYNTGLLTYGLLWPNTPADYSQRIEPASLVDHDRLRSRNDHQYSLTNCDNLHTYTSDLSEISDASHLYGLGSRQQNYPQRSHELEFSSTGESVYPIGLFDDPDYAVLDDSEHFLTASDAPATYGSGEYPANRVRQTSSRISQVEEGSIIPDSRGEVSASNARSGAHQSPFPSQSTYHSYFRDLLEARAYRNRPRSVPQYIGTNDPTIADVRANVHLHVSNLFRAMKNVSGARDEPTSTGYKRFLSSYHKDIDIQARCWEVVELCLDLHEHGFRIDDEENLANHSPRDIKLTCGSRLEELCRILKIEKMMAEDVMTGTTSLMKLVYAPIASERRKIQNRRGNRRKKETLSYAKEIQNERQKASVQPQTSEEGNPAQTGFESDDYSDKDEVMETDI